MIVTEEVYIAHFGKKGMRWGQRSGRQKTAIAGAGAVAGLVGRHVTRHLRTSLSAIGTGAFAAAGAQAMAAHLDKHGDKSVSAFKRDPKTGVRPVAKALNESKFGRAANANAERHMRKQTEKADKKGAKADAKWQKNIYSVHGAVAVHNRTADRLNNGALAEMNAKHTSPIKVGPNGEHDMSHPATRKYVHDYQQLVAHHTAQAVKEVHGTSPSGKFQAKLDTSDKHNWKVKVSPSLVSHGVDGMDSLKSAPKGTPKAPELLMDVEHTSDNKVALHKRIK